MNLIHKAIAKLFAPEESKSATTVVNFDELTSSFLSFAGTSIPPSKAIFFYENSSAVASPIELISEQFAQIEPVLIEKKDGVDIIIKDHPILDLLNNPSRDYDSQLFKKNLATNYLVTDEFYVLAIGRLEKPPLELIPLSPRHMSVVRGGDGFTTSISISDVIGSGNYNRKNVKGSVTYQRDNLTNLYQARGFSTRENSAVRGQSLLGIAADDIRQQILGHKHNNNMLEKGGRLSLVFNVKTQLGDEDFQTIKNRIMAQFGGTSGAQIGVVDAEDMDLKEFGTSNKDMDFVNLRMLSKESIYGIYKVPLEFANQGSSTFNNKSEAKLALYDDAVLPLTKKIYGNLSRMLISRYGLDPSVFRLGIDEDSIEALQTRRLNQLKTRKDLNVETDNEIRGLLGREPLSEGADSLYKPATMLPVASDEDLTNPRVFDDDTD